MMKNPPHVGEVIETQILAHHKLKRKEAANLLRVRPATLSDLVNGRSGLSPEMALRLEKAFGVKVEMLLRMQADYDAAQVRLRSNEIEVLPYEGKP